MQIVIDIDDDLYKSIICHRCKIAFQQKCDYEDLKNAIEDGTPLPKGHGRLIDADEFHHTFEDMPIRDTDKWFNWLQKACIRLAEAPTIVEADTESEG